MNIKQMKGFVAERIKLIDDKGIKEKLSNQNGLLIHVIPENLVKQNLIDWSKESHKKIVNEAFKRLSKINSIYEDLGTGFWDTHLMKNILCVSKMELLRHINHQL